MEATMKYSILFCSLLLANVAAAEPLSAIVTLASKVITADGVTRQTQYQDLLVRDTNSVWSQRILPPGAQPQDDEHDHQHEPHQGHDHNLNFSLAGRWIELDKNNQPRYRLVRTQDKTIIEPRSNEYGTLGFDGVWETAYYQINRASLKNMELLKKSAPANAVWYEKRDEKSFTQILWDAKNEIPLVIETASHNGKIQQKVTFKLIAVPAKLPWETLSDYQTMAYEDLLD